MIRRQGVDLHPKLLSIARSIRIVAGLGSLLFVAGFGWFLQDAGRASPWPPNADGIVALTGGSLRVETALALLHAGVAPRLLISGVGPGVTLSAVLQASDPGPPPSAPIPLRTAGPSTPDAVTLGHAARTTAGNAVEAAWWARANRMHSLVVVTAGYHMRRALAEFGAAIPDVRLTPYAVHPPAGPRVLLLEYVKLIATVSGVPTDRSPGAA